METYGGSGGITPPFFTSAVDGGIKLHASGDLLRGKEPPVPIG
jgi:hypothetical protein